MPFRNHQSKNQQQQKRIRQRRSTTNAIVFLFLIVFVTIFGLLCLAIVSITNINTTIPTIIEEERPSTTTVVQQQQQPIPNDSFLQQHHVSNDTINHTIPYQSKPSSSSSSTSFQNNHLHHHPTTPTTKKKTPNYHIVFSTDCSPYQKWQSYLLFYSAYKVHQRGTITRIASGCSPEETQEELTFHTQTIQQHMSYEYKLHFTPSFSKVSKEETTTTNYPYFNKPFGLLHWMDHHTTNETTIEDEDIIIVLDPDQVLIQPLSHDFTNPITNLLVGFQPYKTRVVRHGTPFAQKYGYYHAWKKLNLTYVTGTPHTPAWNITNPDASTYSVGPPYLATARDMYTIARTWVDFVPRAYEDHPELMAEMFAYSIAAAHLGLPHQPVRSLMVSDVDLNGGSGKFNPEGWWLVNRVDDNDICNPMVVEKYNYTLPMVLHYCQSYTLGKYFFGKRRIPSDIFSCEKPLLVSPPDDIISKYTYSIPPMGTHASMTYLKGNAIKQHAFMICMLTRLVNEASLFYQSTNCDYPKKVNEVLDLWSLKVVKTT